MRYGIVTKFPSGEKIMGSTYSEKEQAETLAGHYNDRWPYYFHRVVNTDDSGRPWWVRLVYDDAWGTSDANAKQIALRNIADLEAVDRGKNGSTHFYFANVAYLNEWIFALFDGRIASLTIVVGDNEYPVAYETGEYSPDLEETLPVAGQIWDIKSLN